METSPVPWSRHAASSRAETEGAGQFRGYPAKMRATDYTQIGPAVGEAFPDFELPDADGRLVRLEEWRRGRRALVIFYRSAAW